MLSFGALGLRHGLGGVELWSDVRGKILAGRPTFNAARDFSKPLYLL